jgi:hypothetical protein
MVIMSKVIKSKEEIFPIVSKELNFDAACKEAYAKALLIWEVDNNGHSKLRKDFPRNESSIQVEFITVQISGSIIGGENTYLFKTWLEKDEYE